MINCALDLSKTVYIMLEAILFHVIPMVCHRLSNPLYSIKTKEVSGINPQKYLFCYSQNYVSQFRP